MENKSKKLLLISAQGRCKSNSMISSILVKYFSENEVWDMVTKAIVRIKDADLILINSCGYRNEDEKFTKDTIENVLKKSKSASKVVSVGCLNKINGQVLKDISNEILLVDNFQEFDSLIKAEKLFNTFKGSYHDKKLFSQIVWARWSDFFMHNMFSKMLSGVTNIIAKYRKMPSIGFELFRKVSNEEDFDGKFYVEIGSGCVSNCSYCRIKKAKGNSKSRPIHDILSDIKEGYKNGMTINLVADDCGSYGADIGLSLFDLINAINKEFSGIPIDLCYVNPLWLEKYTSEYYEIFKKYNISSVNIPIQTGSDRIVKLMNRKYKIENILEIVEHIKKISPKTMLWTHYILDYPTETWKEFWEIPKTLRSFHFAYYFLYSNSDGSSRKKLRDIIRRRVKLHIMQAKFFHLMFSNMLRSLN